MDVEANGIRIHYTVEGEGPPVVLLHGYTLDRTFWEPQVQALRHRYRVIVPDLRGFGESELGSVQTSSMELMADDVRALLDRIAVREPVVLGGLSMGVAVTLAFVEKYPERVRALFLADGRATVDTTEARRARLELAERVERENSTRAARETIFPLLMAEAAYQRPQLVTHVHAMAARPSPAAVAAALRGLANRPDRTPILSRITCPALIVVGEHDALTPPGEARAMHARIPGAELVQVPVVGHLATLEDPESVNRAILGFLERHGV
jgi:pimeloyl-ACP methyl ester carboxylesterase